MDVSLPLVSAIVVNYNYGRYLKAAIESIRAQTYPHIECIIVDNASTDSSGEVLNEIEAADPSIIILRRPDNAGQSAASIDGFRMSRGQFVVFIDADDMLLPEFVRTHVFVHLSLRVHAGMTSSDILQTIDDRVVLATGQAFNDYIRAAPAPDGHLTRPITESLRSTTCFEGFDQSILDRLYFLPPWQFRSAWSPTTGNFFRRDALELFMNARQLPQLWSSTDVFLCVGVGGLCGSVLVDRALSVYRIHGDNFGTRRAQLHGVRNMKPESDLTGAALDALLDHLVRQEKQLAPKLWNQAGYLNLIESIRVWKHDFEHGPPRSGPLWQLARRFLRAPYRRLMRRSQQPATCPRPQPTKSNSTVSQEP